MHKHVDRESSVVAHIANAQCDCACPDGSCPEQVAAGPLIAHLELTAACNNSCVGCCNITTFGHDYNHPGIMAEGQWATILSRLRPHLQRVKLTGGEPTLHYDFSRIVGLLNDMAIPFDLFTNGRWHNPDALVRLLTQSDCFGSCLISLHGPTASVHESFTGVADSFGETKKNILSAIGKGLPVVLSTIITQQNYFLTDDMLSLCEVLGCSHIVFNRYVGPFLPDISPSPQQLREAVQRVDALRSEGHRCKFSVCIPQCFTPSSSQGCMAGIAACTIDPWGNMRPCNHAPLIVGNLFRQGLEEVWYSRLMVQWRKSPDVCHGCSAFSWCRGGCRAQALLSGENHDPLIPTSCQSSTMILSADLEVEYVS